MGQTLAALPPRSNLRDVPGVASWRRQNQENLRVTNDARALVEMGIKGSVFMPAGGTPHESLEDSDSDE